MSTGSRTEGWIESIVASHEALLIRYAQGHVGDLDIARDIVQDTFLKLCVQPRDEVEDHIKPWLYTVCRRRCLDVLKKERRMVPLTDSQAGSMASTAVPPIKALERRDSLAEAEGLLSELADNQREAVRLKIQGELSYREISEVMGISMSNVGYLLHQGLSKLRQQWRLQNAS